jgi:VCBS repeat-containing protein
MIVCSHLERVSHFGLVACLALMVVAHAAPAAAQVLIAEDDTYELVVGETLVVDPFGVLDNDMLDGENAGESGATAELVTDVSHGTLTLAANGSFSYSPGTSFEGTDSFVYRAVFSSASDEATVTLTACAGGPQIFTCWKEAAFLAKAAALGHPSFAEGFEDDAVWGVARSPITVLNVSSRGFEWRANDFDPTHVDPPQPPPPPPNHITTGSGPARSGQWGVFDLGHGYATGSSVQCDIDNPPAHCLYHDGFTVRREAGSSPLFGAGGFFTGSYGANVAIVLDGDWQNPIGGGKLAGGGHQFFGVIDAGPAGLTEVQFRETDGKIGQALLLFGDDFTLLAEPNPVIPALTRPGVTVLGLLLVGLAVAYLRRRTARA